MKFGFRLKMKIKKLKSTSTKRNDCINIGSDWEKAGKCVQKQKKAQYLHLIHGSLILIKKDK
jgi:hypothetical protein